MYKAPLFRRTHLRATALLPLPAALLLCAWTLVRPSGAAEPETKSALETDSSGWVDIMPAADLHGWYRVPVPPTGKLGKQQWHTANQVLVCDGDGGHDMLLYE